MITEKQLVEYHVLDNQSAVISALANSNLIEDEAIYNDDVLEWWLVTPTLARWLTAEDEIILEDLGCFWWGRQTSGQAIYIDSVITDIVNGFN